MKFATIAVLAVAATSVEAKSCGTTTTQGYSDNKCTKPVGKARTADLSKTPALDTCKGAGQTSMKVMCDTAGFHTNLYKDAKCTAAKKDAAKSKTVEWGKCTHATGKVWVIVKGAEALKVAVTGAALALVASQF